MDYVMRAVTVPGLNAQQQIEVTLEGGLRCHRLGLWRKYALFLYIAALMCADNENFGVANALVSPFPLLFNAYYLFYLRHLHSFVVAFRYGTRATSAT